MKLSARIVAPLVIVIVAGLITILMFSTRQDVEYTEAAVVAPLVEFMTVRPAPAALQVISQGIVEPRTESELVAEVSGRVVWVSPQLASGGFFKVGDPLVRVDARDYEMTLAEARASLDHSRSSLVHAEAELARQRSMRGGGASSKALLDDSIHAEAVAISGQRKSEIALERAKLDLERTQIKAPFVGRVREKQVDVGQFIARGSNVARIYAIDYAEVRLPIADEDVAVLDLPLGYREDSGLDYSEVVEAAPIGPRVTFSAALAGKEHRWPGQIVRTEGTLDAQTRMITAVARIDDPYARGSDPTRPPLPMGLYVEAEIEGRVVEDVIEIPRAALRERDLSVIIIDENDRLRLRPVDVLRSERDRVWIRSGLYSGQRVVTTPIDVFVEGMEVRTAGAASRIGGAPRAPDGSGARGS